MKNQQTEKQIVAQLVKSNASDYLVWEVSITGSRRKKHYCKTARKTLGFLYIYKKQTGIDISRDTIRHLTAIIAKQRAAQAAVNTTEEAR